MKPLTLTALGLSGPEWIKRLEKKKYRVSDWAKQVLNSPEYEKHRLKKGQKITVALIKTADLGKTYATTQELQDYAKTQGYEMPSAEIALLIREAVSDEQMEDMGAWYIAALHDSIKDSVGGPFVLLANRFDVGQWLYAYFDNPGLQWYGDGLFAFPVPAKSSGLEVQTLDSETWPLDELEARVSKLEAWQKRM